MNEVWDLTPIYKGFDDPAFDADMQEMKALVEQIVTYEEEGVRITLPLFATAE